LKGRARLAMKRVPSPSPAPAPHPILPTHSHTTSSHEPQLIGFAAFVKLRISHPDLQRPYRIPVNTVGACLILIGPLALLGYILYMVRRERSARVLSDACILFKHMGIGCRCLRGAAAHGSWWRAYRAS
jgi:hypothetical protein